eukprot:1469295-Amphidinium_carterae.1
MEFMFMEAEEEIGSGLHYEDAAVGQVQPRTHVLLCHKLRLDALAAALHGVQRESAPFLVYT